MGDAAEDLMESEMRSRAAALAIARICEINECQCTQWRVNDGVGATYFCMGCEGQYEPVDD